MAAEFVTKDSGQRQEFASGMVRDVSTDKVKYHLPFSGPMFKRWAGLLTRGAVKYTEDNWMLAQGEAEMKRFRESAVRHFFQWLNGETDEDHAAAVFFNINGYEYVTERLAAVPVSAAEPEPVPYGRPLGRKNRINANWWCAAPCEVCDRRWAESSPNDKRQA